STAGQPGMEWLWFNTYLDYVKANDVVPDYLSWHQLIPDSDPQASKKDLDEMLSARGISVQGYQVNEYGSNTTEQEAGPSAWYLARFERLGIDALRANWGMGGGLYTGMGDLVTPSEQPTASWWTYHHYANMTGALVAVSAGSKVDGVAATDSAAKTASVVLGSRTGVAGVVTVQFNHLPSYLQSSGKTRVKVERMPEGIGPVSAPLVVSDQTMTVSNNTLTLTVNWTHARDAYAITLTP
ncbi:MAG TPA: beta-xylosidase, partial [Anaerolineae bacterium]|nr:beta-xylosidase [Anaerolineae bacterium]